MGPYSHALALGTTYLMPRSNRSPRSSTNTQAFPSHTGSRPTSASRAANSPRPSRMIRISLPVVSTRVSPAPPSIPQRGSRIRSSVLCHLFGLRLAFQRLRRRELKYGDSQTYLPEALFGGVHWDEKHNRRSSSTNVTNDLAEALKTNPRLRIMVNGGYYDLATPFFAAQYEEKHLPIPQSLAKTLSTTGTNPATWSMSVTNPSSSSTTASPPSSKAPSPTANSL